MERCSTKDCTNQARCAIRTTRPKRDDLRTTLFYDDRVAPKAATRYCKDCAQKLLPGLCAIIDNDAEYKEADAA
jgi:hypothetical protein